jgi:hypothetical protein
MLVAIDAQNVASKVYENKTMKNKHGGIVRVADFLYGYSDDIGWLCMSFRTGERIWRDRESLGMGAVGYADGKLYCIDQSEGNVVLIDASPEGWIERGRFALAPLSTNRSPQGGIWVHPVVVNGRLYLRDQELLYCYDVKNH